MTLLMKKPEGQVYKIFAFMEPFDGAVWLSIFVVVSWSITDTLLIKKPVHTCTYVFPKGNEPLSLRVNEI